MTHYRSPTRNLIIYGDGRIFETREELAGVHFYVTERRGEKLVDRAFDVEYAAMENGDHCLVALERMDPKFHERPPRQGTIINATLLPVTSTPGYPKTAKDIHLECIKAGGHILDEMSGECQSCHLSGRYIWAQKMIWERELKERQDIAALRDQLVQLKDQLRTIKAENSDLRRETERLQRREKK